MSKSAAKKHQATATAAFSRHGGAGKAAKAGHIGFIERPDPEFLKQVKAVAASPTSQQNVKTEIDVSSLTSAPISIHISNSENKEIAAVTTTTTTTTTSTTTSTTSTIKASLSLSSPLSSPLSSSSTLESSKSKSASLSVIKNPGGLGHQVIMHVPGPYRQVEPKEKIWERQAQEMKRYREERERMDAENKKLQKAKEEKEKLEKELEQELGAKKKAHGQLHDRHKYCVHLNAEKALVKALCLGKTIGVCVWTDNTRIEMLRRNRKEDAKKSLEQVSGENKSVLSCPTYLYIFVRVCFFE